MANYGYQHNPRRTLDEEASAYLAAVATFRAEGHDPHANARAAAAENRTIERVYGIVERIKRIGM